MIFLISIGVEGDILASGELSSASLSNKSYNLASDKSYNMVWIVIDKLSLDQLLIANTPNIDKLQKKGAFSLMNVRTVDHLHTESTYLSVNAGNRCQGSKMSHNGISSGKGAINNEIEGLIALNSNTNYKAKPGLLGDLAKENNITVGVLGNSDIVAKKSRAIVSMAMDSTGFVPYAEIGENILQKTNKPWGYQSDYSKLADKFIEYKGQVDALFIETGDISRIENFIELEESNSERKTSVETFGDKITENSILSDINQNDYYQGEKINALERIDAFLGFMIDNIDLEKTQVAIIVPTPAEEAIQQGKRLTWVLFAGRGINHGWLKSDSTRRKGIITISDLLSGFLAANLDKNSLNKGLNSNTSKKDLEGKVLEDGVNNGDDQFASAITSVKDMQANWKDLKQLNEKVSFIYNIRSPFIQVFIFLQMVVLIMAISKTVWKKINQKYIFYRSFEYLLIALLLVPINYMLLSLFNIFTILGNIILLFCIFVIEELLLFKMIKKPTSRIFIISWLMVLLVSINLIDQYALLADSILGYSSIIGARYYGLGNEYMGFYLGAFILAITVTLEISKDRSFKVNPILIVFSFLIITYFVGAATLGANFGGMITVLTTGGITCYYIFQNKNWMNKWLILGLGLLFLVIMLILDYSGIMGNSSHIGQAVQRLIDSDWQWIFNTIMRKFTMNLKLLRWTIWSRVLLIMIIYLFVLLRKPVPGLKIFFEKNFYYRAGLYGALVGSLVTMLVNDSGVVAAATILFYPVMSLLYFLK